jgi:hypothetical protein
LADVAFATDYAPGAHLACISTDQIRVMITADKMSDQAIREKAQDLIKSNIVELCRTRELRPLTTKEPYGRLTLTVNGGVASGKGTSEKILRYCHEKRVRSI